MLRPALWECCLLIAILVASTAWMTTAQIEPLPSILQTSYVTVDPLGLKVKISFRSERGKLVAYEEWADGKQNAIEISWPDIVAISVNTPMPGGKWSVMIQQNLSGVRYIPFNSEEDAASAARYFSKLSGIKISTGSEASSTPGPSVPAVHSVPEDAFNCPLGTGPSCESFKDLLDHRDSDILGYLHPKNSARAVACFSTEGENKSFVAEYSPAPEKQGTFSITIFEKGVQGNSDYGSIRWVSQDLGLIEPFFKTDSLGGSITNAEFNYHQEFTNISKTKTQHSIAIRWSTGKYVEKYIFPDEKGQPQLFTYSGICARLN